LEVQTVFLKEKKEFMEILLIIGGIVLGVVAVYLGISFVALRFLNNIMKEFQDQGK
jgi:hypothetical protein